MKKLSQNKKMFITVAIGIVLCLIVVKLAFFTPYVVPYAPSSDPGVTQQKTIHTVTYNQNDEHKLVDKFEKRQTLANADQAARTKILTFLPTNEQSGTIYQAADYKIDYVHSANLFQVEIQTTAIEPTKQTAENWFFEQGLSQQGICDLPVQFYVSFDVMSQLQGKNITVSPLAPGC